MISIVSKENIRAQFFISQDKPSFRFKRIEVDLGGELSYQNQNKRYQALIFLEGNGNDTFVREFKDYDKEQTNLNTKISNSNIYRGTHLDLFWGRSCCYY